MRPSIGRCDKCRAKYEYQIIHNGFNDTAYAYCDTCGMTTFVGGWDDTGKPATAPLKLHGPIQPETEPWLQPCSCGGRFRHDASPRCPHCSTALSAQAATSFIERNAEGTRSGWRWQRSWSGMYCLIVAGSSTKNNWRAAPDAVALPLRLNPVPTKSVSPRRRPLLFPGKRNAAALMFGVATAVSIWLITSQMIWQWAGMHGGSAAQEDSVPYVNTHMLEQAREGKYDPLRDRAFVVTSVVIDVATFLIGPLLATVAAHRQSKRIIGSAVYVVLLCVWSLLHWFIFTPSYPAPMRTAFVFESIIALVCGAFGICLGSWLSERSGFARAA
jgi:hypothetical protein